MSAQATGLLAFYAAWVAAAAPPGQRHVGVVNAAAVLVVDAAAASVVRCPGVALGKVRRAARAGGL